MVIPIILVIFQLNSKIEMKTMTNMPNKMLIEQTMPVEDTGTGFWKTIVNINHGKGRLKKIRFSVQLLKIKTSTVDFSNLKYTAHGLMGRESAPLVN